MSIGLTNARLSAANTGASTYVQKITPARTSIAEDAIFIPKPHKRVTFELKSDTEVQLPGSGKPNLEGGPAMIGDNIKMGNLGTNGISAAITSQDYNGAAQRVEMTVDLTPEKDFMAIAPQEEGRQTNNAQTTHYSQQYDSYGRPRIGFSREPYDFAATKYIAKTSEIKFQENIDAAYNSFAFADMRLQESGQDGLSSIAASAQASAASQAEPAVASVTPLYEKGAMTGNYTLPGESGEESAGIVAMDEKMAPQVAEQKLPGSPKEEKPQIEKTGVTVSAMAEKMGIDFNRLISPANRGAALSSHEISPEKFNDIIAVTA